MAEMYYWCTGSS